MRIASIDFETANHSDLSICAAGLAVFEDGQLTESRYWLVKPPKGYGWFREDFIAIHGITHEDVRDTPEFPVIAPELLTRLTVADVVVAHNAMFDMRKLRATVEHFGLPCPAFDYLCTLQLARRIWPELANHQLHTVAAHIGHKFNHHHAQEDAEAAGCVMLAMMKQARANAPAELIPQVDMASERFLTNSQHG